MRNITSIVAATCLLSACSTLSLPSSGGNTLSKLQMDLEWKTASTQCKNLYRQYKRSIAGMTLDNFEDYTEVDRKALATAEQYNCNEKYLDTLAVEKLKI